MEDMTTNKQNQVRLTIFAIRNYIEIINENTVANRLIELENMVNKQKTANQ
jgi:hypothetical protein